jgi:hypothetical protein
MWFFWICLSSSGRVAWPDWVSSRGGGPLRIWKESKKQYLPVLHFGLVDWIDHLLEKKMRVNQ